MIKTITQLVAEGWSRKILYQLAHMPGTPAFKTSRKGHWRFDEDELKAFVKRRWGRSLICLMFFLLISLPHKVQADVITRETCLGGMSKALSDFYDKGGRLFNEDEVNLLAEVMYHENYCNGEYIMLLTGSVVLNRVKASWYPNTIKGVLYQKGQYATAPRFFTKPIPEEVYWLAKKLLLGGSIAPEDVVFQSMFKQGRYVWYVDKGEYFCGW